MKTHHFSDHSFLKSCEHDDEKNVMRITFNNGKTYSYGDCSHRDFEAFKNAESAGKHYAIHIKNSKGIYQP